MRVAWTEVVDVPEEYWNTGYIPPIVTYRGEVVGTVNTFFGGTKFVVMLDSGSVVEVPVNQVRRED